MYQSYQLHSIEYHYLLKICFKKVRKRPDINSILKNHQTGFTNNYVSLNGHYKFKYTIILSKATHRLLTELLKFGEEKW